MPRSRSKSPWISVPKGRQLGPDYWEAELKKISREYRPWAASVLMFRYAPATPRQDNGLRQDYPSWAGFIERCMTQRDIPRRLRWETLHEELLKIRVFTIQPRVSSFYK